MFGVLLSSGFWRIDFPRGKISLRRAKPKAADHLVNIPVPREARNLGRSDRKVKIVQAKSARAEKKIIICSDLKANPKSH